MEARRLSHFSHIPTYKLHEARDILRRAIGQNDLIIEDFGRLLEKKDFPIVEGTGKYWRSMRVKLYAYTYLEGDEGASDEPEFVVATTLDGEQSAYHVPALQKTVPARTLETTQNDPGRGTVLFHDHLDDEREHEFNVTAVAFDSDMDEAWEKLVDALGLDLEAVGRTVITPHMGGLASGGAFLSLLKQNINSLLKNSPDMIGDETPIMDVKATWERDPAKRSWTGYKFTIHARPGQDAWYMSLWRIDLDARPGALHFAALPMPREEATGIGYAAAVDALKPGALELAAVRTLAGEELASVAAELGADPARVAAMRARLTYATPDEFSKVALRAAFTELALLRERTASPKPRKPQG